ncbi:hypothetical protein [Mesorhizobium sp. 2RAF21]|uniref:hypothetical protein n=1 Tax=Mesorhizobium sp. 2RAF21 TaxID=3232995 RepID=UPI003F995AC8
MKKIVPVVENKRVVYRCSDVRTVLARNEYDALPLHRSGVTSGRLISVMEA